MEGNTKISVIIPIYKAEKFWTNVSEALWDRLMKTWR